MPRVKGNSHVLLCGMAAFMWDREKISNQEILRCVYVCACACACACVPACWSAQYTDKAYTNQPVTTDGMYFMRGLQER